MKYIKQPHVRYLLQYSQVSHRLNIAYGNLLTTLLPSIKDSCIPECGYKYERAALRTDFIYYEAVQTAME